MEQQQERDRKGRRAGEHRRRKKRRQELSTGVVRPFVGVDGEGGNLSDDRFSHSYMLLRAGDHVLETGKPLTTWECLEFLATLPRGPLYVSYFFDYDTTHILRNLPTDILERVLDRPVSESSRGTVDVGKGYWVGYIPRKELRVRKGSSGPYTVINDTGSFFQCRFLTALDDWGIGTESEREDIRRGKDLRAEFGRMTDEIREYNKLEIRLLGELMTEFRKACRDAGYMPSSWQGPGCLATAMMRKHKIPKRKALQTSELIPPMLWNDANDSYYGGRFEVTATGQIDNPVSQSDINSAYPAAMQELPCLIHGEWYHERLPHEMSSESVECLLEDKSDLWLGHGTFTATQDAWLYGLPVRSKNGTIRFPANGNGWYWSPEVRQAKHQRFLVSEYWAYVKCCDCKPFDFLSPLYEERKRIGKTGKGKVLKLGMNSLYGKTAQSVGHAPYANPIHASLITALTRSKMMGKVHESNLCAGNSGMCGKDVYMLATDGLFRDGRLHIGNSSSTLGGWDVTEHEGMFIVQPGLYYCEGNELAKTRGLPRERFVEFLGRFRECWNRIGIGTELVSDVSDWNVSVPVQSFVGLRLARVRNWKRLGQWDHKCEQDGCRVTTNHIHKTVSFDWSGKRHVWNGEVQGNAWRSRPQQGDVSEVNHPYDKAIGAWRNDERLLTEDNPDWSIFI